MKKQILSIIALFFGSLFFTTSIQAAAFNYGPQPFGPYDTHEEWRSYESKIAGGEVRYFIVKPKENRQFPGIYYIYGRPGFDHRLQPEVRRLASYGFTVFVVHFQEALLIPILIPFADPPEVKDLQEEAFDVFLTLKERTPGKICVMSEVRGGMYGVPLSAKRPEDVACYLGMHPVITDHGEPEPYQNVTILQEIRDLIVPTMFMVGDGDFEVRQNQSKRAYEYMRMHGREVELVLYPQATRGFDFRVRGRSLANDLAKIDSMNRAVAFLKKHLGVQDYSNNQLSSTAFAPMHENIRLPSPDRPGRPANSTTNTIDDPEPTATDVAETIQVLIPQQQPANIALRGKNAPGGKYAVQVASYSRPNEAEKVVMRLRKMGYDANSHVVNLGQRGTWYRVRVGIFNNKNNAASMQAKLVRDGYDPIVTIRK